MKQKNTTPPLPENTEAGLNRHIEYCLNLVLFLKRGRAQKFCDDKAKAIDYPITPKQIAQIREEIARVERYIGVLRESVSSEMGLPYLETVGDAAAFAQSLAHLKFREISNCQKTKI